MKEKYLEEMQKRDKQISEQMQEGFEISSESQSIRSLVNKVKSGKIHDAPYQRGDVWDNGRKKALIESIMKYGGKKVPALVFRKLNDGTMEIVDGKQRLLSAIIQFYDGKFALNGISTKEFTGYKINDIEQNYPLSYASFMSTEIPVLVLSNMSDEEAIIYFHQVNSSGVQMSCGEKIHAMQDTPIIKAIEKLTSHKVWENIRYVKRYNDYEYVAKMLLYVKDTNPNLDFYRADHKHRILNELDAYRSTEVPNEMVQSVKDVLDFLEKVFQKYNFSLTIREFYNTFTYVFLYKDSLKVSDFGRFIKDLYHYIHETNEAIDMNRFRVIKDKHMEKGFSYTSEYYKWYANELNHLYSRFIAGEKWDDIKQL